jgi:hypothetical protein
VLKQSFRDFAADKIDLGRKIETVTEGLPRQVSRKLKSVNNDGNVVDIANFIGAMKTEINISDNYRGTVIKTLSLLSAYHNHMDFRKLMREDLLAFYLESDRKRTLIAASKDRG